MSKLHIDVEIREIIPSYDLLNKQSWVIIILISSKTELFNNNIYQECPCYFQTGNVLR